MNSGRSSAHRPDRNLSARMAFAWLIFVLLIALFADLLPLLPPDQMDWFHSASPPGTHGDYALSATTANPGPPRNVYLLGTDKMGRDILSRVAHGARVSLSVGIVAPLSGILIGGFLGMTAGYLGGRAETVIMAAMDAVLAFPGMVLLLAAGYFFGQGLGILLATLGFLTIPAFCRVARARTLTVAGLEFVQAARMMGASRRRVMICEIFPNIFISLMIYGLFVSAYVILLEGGLSFLGLGLPPPTPSWGGMIAEGKEVLKDAPFVAMIPASAMFLTVLSLNLLGDFLQSRFDSRERQL